MISQLINRDCKLIRRSDTGEEDELGNTIPTETVVETVCELQQRRRDEPDMGGEVSQTDWVAFFLPTEDVDTNDLLVVDGLAYELVGDPWTVRDPLAGTDSHIEASVERAGGFREGS